jgi:indole-3-glycerol phosphate synthase
VLLIVRMVPRERLVAMLDCAAELGLFVLLEAFDADDLAVAGGIARDRAGRDEQVLMGLNCRDLETLEIDFQRFAKLRSRMPLDWPCVAESGVQTPDDAARVVALGYRLALVGTGLMRRADPARALGELLEAGRKALP